VSHQPVFITRSKPKWDNNGLLFGIVFSDGEAAVLTPMIVPTTSVENEPQIYFSGTVIISTENNNSSLNTHININGKLQKDSIRKLTAVQMALNMKHNLVAIGCASGDTVLYDLSHKRIGRVLSLLPWGITSDITGNVSCMQWTPDETALCVAWDKRGLAVWSIYGCRLFCTIPQLESSVNRPMHVGSEPLKDGVSSISWGSEGYYLFIGVRDLSPEGSSLGVQFSFIKSISTNMTNWQNGCEKILLQGEEQLLILTYKGKQLGDISWKYINIPHVYLADNWPIRYVSVSRDGNQIGAAGKHGIALYNMLSKRWKLFGDRNQEAQIRCCGLSWFKQAVIIIANEILTGHSVRYQLLLYPKGHLDASSLLYKCNIPQKPLFMDCNDKFLIIFTTSNIVLQYRIRATFSEATTEIESVELDLMRQLSMTFLSTSEAKSFVSGFNTVPLSFTLLPTFSPNSNNEISQCLILASSGDLLLVRVEQSTQVLLAKHVEQYWIANSYSVTTDNNSNPDGNDQDFRNTLWSYGESGLQVWFPFLSKGQALYPTQHPSSSDIQIAVESTKLTTLSRDKSLEFDLEVYPIGFVSELGVIVGLTQELEFTCNSKIPHFGIQIKTHPFLHSILRRLLERVSTKPQMDNYSAAYTVAQKFSFIPHFDHSLELLLHETLEDEKIDNINFITSPLLQKVVTFIKKFSQFPDVVASCARKTDPAIWKQLFSLAGSPKYLFDQCLARKKVQTAASYLRILQYIEGKPDARLCALKLLDEALNIDDLELAGDLRRFLLPDEEMLAEPRGVLTHVPFEGSGEFSEMLSPDDQEYYLQELLLARYARKLLHQQQLKKLIIFGKKVSHDLRPWLVRERRRAAALEETGLETALTIVHLQFHIPYPEAFHDSLTLPTLSLSQLNEEQAEQCLQFLLQEMLATQCVEWSLVLATVLLNATLVVQILRDSFHLWKEYHSMLTNQRWCVLLFIALIVSARVIKICCDFC